MKVSYKQLQSYFKEKLPEPEKLAEAFTFHFAEVESVEKSGEDSILDVKVLPDRACYAKSMEGIAFEVGAILNLKPNIKEIPKTKKINAKVSDINRSLGTEISKDEIISILGRLNISIDEQGNDKLVLSIPENRLDLNDWRDIPEEIGRIYGYDKIGVKYPEKTKSPVPEKTFYYSEKIKNILCGLGFSEVYLYTLVPKGFYKIEKPLAADKNHLRTNLSDGIVKALDLNAKNADLLGLDEIKIFEIGKVFTKEGEQTWLGIGIKNVKKKQAAENVKLVEAAEAISKALGITVPTVKGNIFEINLDDLIENLPEPKSYNDLNFGKAASIEYNKFSLQPFIIRDIAIFVPSDVDAKDVQKKVESAARSVASEQLIKGPDLFDQFEKEGKKSCAFRMIFQASDRTLTDEEVNSFMAQVYEAVKKENWQVR